MTNVEKVEKKLWCAVCTLIFGGGGIEGRLAKSSESFATIARWNLDLPNHLVEALDLVRSNLARRRRQAAAGHARRNETSMLRATTIARQIFMLADMMSDQLKRQGHWRVHLASLLELRLRELF